MDEHKDQNIVRAYHAADRARLQFWAIVLTAAVLCTGIALYYSYNLPDAKTTAQDGRKLESPGTATGGSAR